MVIRIADKTLGEIVINVHTDIGKLEEYIIKSLGMLQMMCMNTTDSPEKLSEFTNIMKEAIDKTNDLYKELDNESSDPTEHLGI